MSDALPSAAVIIPTQSVDAQARRAVQAIRDAHPWAEIHLIPDALPPSDSPLPCHIHPSGPVTIAAKRNLGASKTDADILAFIDSDAWPDGDWLGQGCRWLQALPELAAVGGPNTSPPGQPPKKRWVGQAMKSAFVTGPGRFRKRRDATARDIDDHLPTCNLIVRRINFDTLGGMDERLRAGEDRDFCERLLLAGGRILFAPDVRVFHEDRGIGALFQHRFRYGATLPPILISNLGRPGWMGRYLPLLLPTAFVGWIALAPGIWAVPLLGGLHRLSLLAYGGALSLEALRLSEKKRDTPGTCFALLLGNIAPGIGTWSYILGLGPGRDLDTLLKATRPGEG